MFQLAFWIQFGTAMTLAYLHTPQHQDPTMDAMDAKSGTHVSDGEEVLENDQRPIVSSRMAAYMYILIAPWNYDQHVFQNSDLPDSQPLAEQDDHRAEARQPNTALLPVVVCQVLQDPSNHLQENCCCHFDQKAPATAQPTESDPRNGSQVLCQATVRLFQTISRVNIQITLLFVACDQPEEKTFKHKFPVLAST